MHIREAAEEYIAFLKNKRRKKNTIQNAAHFLTVFSTWCETQQPSVSLEELRAKSVDSFVTHLCTSKHLATSTLATYVKVILSFLHWCLEDEEYSQYVKLSVVKRIKKPKIEQKIIEIFSSGQFDSLTVAVKQEYNGHLQQRDRAILTLLLDTGIRADELCTLTIANIHTDPKDAYIRVHGKGNKWREIGLGDRSRREIKTYLRLYRLNADRAAVAFLNRYQQPLSPDGLYQLIRRLGKWAEITGVRCSPHTFRHTFAVNYLLQGGDIFMLSRLMGHTSVATTQIYLQAVKAIQARQSSKSVLDNLS